MEARNEVTKLGSNDGFAMAATLGVLTLLSVLVIAVFADAMASFRSGMTDLEKSRTYFAAEAAAESAMAQLALVHEDAVIEDQELNGIVAPTIEGFTFDSFSVVRKDSVTTERITDGPFAGLFSRTQVVEITSEAVSSDYTRSAVMVTAKAQAIPIFQFGVFFEKDLEITNGPRLDFDGWVHSNGNIYLNSANQYFGDIITTPNDLYKDRKDEHGTKTGMYVPSAAASDLSGARGEIDSAESEGLPSADANLLRQMIDDLIDVINNGGDPINGGGGGSPLCDNGITHTRSAGLISPNANQCSDIFFFSYDKWYEGREQRYVDIIDIDVTALYAWIGMGVSRQTGTMYITIDGTNPALDPNGDGTYPVIRLINASSLSAPITFATNHPIYVQGYYNNNAAWYPSALVGDAVTFLSTVWDDADHQAATQIRPTAADTDIYAALMAGHSGTPCDHEVAPCGITSPYGGGLENFPPLPRGLEPRDSYVPGLACVADLFAAVDRPMGQWSLLQAARP